MTQSRLWPYALILFAGIIWGVTFSLARLATEDGAHPLGLTFWQGFGGGLVLLFFCTLRRRWPAITRQHLGFYVVIGILGSIIPAAIYFYAAPQVPAGILAITVALVPLLTYAISWMLGLETYSSMRIAGVIVGLLAIILLVAPDASLPERTTVGWVLLALLASVFYTVENIYVDTVIPKDSDMLALLAGALLVAGIIMLPIVIVQDAFVPLTGAWDQTELAVIAMAIISSIAYTMYFYALQIAGPVFASQTANIVTLSGVFWGILIFDESHSVWVWTALALLMIGLALVTPRIKKSLQVKLESPTITSKVADD